MTPAEFQTWLRSPTRRPLVMGVLNVTPDSFSDGGQFADATAAARHAQSMLENGADLFDVGGESTRPGSQPVAPDVQVARVVPVVRAIAEMNLPVTMSVDTTRAAVAEAALDAGAHVINDISAARDDPDMLALAASRDVPIVLMHMQGTPATMQANPHYADVTAEVIDFLTARVEAAVSAGILRENVLLDLGIGFGKTVSHNLELLRKLAEIAGETDRPLVVGTSRKGFIGRVTGESDPSRRLFGTAATVAWAAANGAGVLRVHDVGAMAQVIRMIDAIQNKRQYTDG
jgi:dihydropteroate synthase